MSFSQLQSSHLAPATMGEDSMEISSDNGHNMMGDEDIDIDIDLTTGPVDEDYILEDAQSDIAFDDSFDLQGNNHTQTGDDDLMADDDHHSFSMNDAEAEVDPDEEVRDALEETVDVTEEMVTSNVGNNEWQRIQEADIHANQDDPAMSGDQPPAEEVQQITEEPHIEPPPVLTNNENTSIDIPVVATSEPVAASEEVIQETLKKDGSSDEAPAQPEETLAEGNLKVEAEEQKPVESQETVDAIENTVNVAAEALDENVSSHSAERKVTVIYQDSEYELFSSSDADHPDLFFLEDRSMLHEPIDVFLAALKAVIHDDVSAEDELCLAIDELGIELSETSANISELTFSQVLDLYDQLMRNDGVTTPTQVHVTIGLRPDFAKKFANLRTSASEGKGLSQIVTTWDEGSESLDDQELFNQIEESEIHEDGYYEEGVDPSEITGLDELEQKDSQPNGEGTNNVQTATQSTHEDSHTDTTTDIDNVNLSTEKTNSPYGLDQNTVEHEAADEVPATSTESSEVHQNQEATSEEGDLLDYSEDEDETESALAKSTTSGAPAHSSPEETIDGTSPYFIKPCYHPNVCFCSECNECLVAEYQAKEEQLRQRSLSIANEEPSLDNIQGNPSEFEHTSTEQFEEPEDQQAEQGEEQYNESNEGDNDNTKDSSNHTGEEPSNEDQTANDTLTQDDEFDNTTLAEHGEDTLYYEQEGEQDSEHDETDIHKFTGASSGEEVEILHEESTNDTFNENTETNNSVKDSQTDDHLAEEDQSSGSVTVVGDVQTADEINYDEAFDTTEPSLLEPITEEQSETLQDPEEDQDEIDYDDDEPQEVPQIDEVQVPQSPSSVGKRRHSVVDEQDDVESENQDAKRLRS